MQRVGGQVGGVRCRGQQPAQLGRHVVRRSTRAAAQERLALDELHGGAAGGPRGAAQPLRVEAGLDHAVALDAHRDPHEVAAGGAAGGAGVRTSRPARPSLGGPR